MKVAFEPLLCGKILVIVKFLSMDSFILYVVMFRNILVDAFSISYFITIQARNYSQTVLKNIRIGQGILFSLQ